MRPLQPTATSPLFCIPIIFTNCKCLLWMLISPQKNYFLYSGFVWCKNEAGLFRVVLFISCHPPFCFIPKNHSDARVLFISSCFEWLLFFQSFVSVSLFIRKIAFVLSINKHTLEFNYHLLQNPMKIWGPEGWGGGRLHSWVNFCWVCATGLSVHLPHYRAILWPNIDSILATFGKMSFSRSQLGHNFLFTRLP